MQSSEPTTKFPPGPSEGRAGAETADREDLRGWHVITPTQPLLDFQVRELWRHRDLIYIFFRRDFVATYKQTVLGPIWFFAQPILTSLVFWVVFGRVGKIVTKGVPQFLFFMAGIIIWNFFSNCFLRTAGTLSNNVAIFSKVYFPRLTVPLSGVLNNGVVFATQFLCFGFFFVVSWRLGVKVLPNRYVLLLPLLLVETTALALGTGLVVAALTTRFRDLSIAVAFGVQLMMYASCVVFPLSSIAPDQQWLFILNPMVPIIEAFRLGFLGSGTVQSWQLGLSFATSFILLFIGLIMFRKVEATALDTV